MPTYTLNNTAGDIDSALQKVVGATTTPIDQSPLMVTSGGVKAYVDNISDALNTTVNDLVAKSNLTNVSGLFATPISTTGSLNQTSVSLNIGEFSQHSTTVALQSVDYVLCALYIYVGNNDSNNIYSVSVRDKNAYSCVSATSVKYKTYVENTTGTLNLHDIILIPTLGFTSGNYQFDYRMSGTGTWNIRVDLTGFIGKPA